MCTKAQRLEMYLFINKSLYNWLLASCQTPCRKLDKIRFSAQGFHGQENRCFSHYSMPKFNTYFYERMNVIPYSSRS